MPEDDDEGYYPGKAAHMRRVASTATSTVLALNDVVAACHSMATTARSAREAMDRQEVRVREARAELDRLKGIHVRCFKRWNKAMCRLKTTVESGRSAPDEEQNRG